MRNGIRDTESHGDALSVIRHVSLGSRRSNASSSCSSRKSALKKSLVAKMKLEKARSRLREQLELTATMELAKLEDEAEIAELEWKIESGYDDETGLVSGMTVPGVSGQAQSVGVACSGLAHNTHAATVDTSNPVSCHSTGSPSDSSWIRR